MADSTVVKIAFAADQASLRQVSSKLGKMFASLGSVSRIAGGVFAGIGVGVAAIGFAMDKVLDKAEELTKKFKDSNDQLAKMNDLALKYNTNAGKVQRFMAVSEQLGVNQGTASSLLDLFEKRRNKDVKEGGVLSEYKGVNTIDAFVGFMKSLNMKDVATRNAMITDVFERGGLSNLTPYLGKNLEGMAKKFISVTGGDYNQNAAKSGNNLEKIRGEEIYGKIAEANMVAGTPVKSLVESIRNQNQLNYTRLEKDLTDVKSIFKTADDFKALQAYCNDLIFELIMVVSKGFGIIPKTVQFAKDLVNQTNPITIMNQSVSMVNKHIAANKRKEKERADRVEAHKKKMAEFRDKRTSGGG